MLDVSWTEILLLLIIGIMVIGPKQLPSLMYGLGKIVRRFQYMKFAVSNQFDDFMQQQELKETPSLRMPSHEEDEIEDEEEIEAELSFLKNLNEERERKK